MSKKDVRAGIGVAATVLILAGVMVTNFAFSQGVKAGEWTMDYDAALKFAQKEKLPILLNFTGSDWCSWCQLMQRNVFAQEKWAQYAKNRIVLVTLDFPRNKSLVSPEYATRNNRLQQQYGVQGYPTYIILDSDGKTILGKLGAGREKTAESFIQEVEELLLLSETEIQKTLSKLSPGKAKAYRAAVERFKTTRAELERWLSTRPLRTDENLKKYNLYLAEIENSKKQLQQFK